MPNERVFEGMSMLSRFNLPSVASVACEEEEGPLDIGDGFKVRDSESKIQRGEEISISISEEVIPGVYLGHDADAFAGPFRQSSERTCGWSHWSCAAIVTLEELCDAIRAR